MTHKIVVIGNGIAGITSIKAIREIDKESSIHLIGDEKFYPYNRVRLSKGLLSSLEEDKILLQKKEWYQDNNIQLSIGVKAVSIDTKEKSVTLSNGQKIPYDKLLLANGSHAVLPPAPGMDKQGIFTLKTLQNAKDIIEYVHDKEKVFVLGGGIQGLEAAWILKEMGKKVTLSHRSERLMRRQLDQEASEILQGAIRASGIELLLNNKVNEVLGNDHVTGVKTSDGTVECNAIVYSIGTKPNLDILENTGLESRDGIIVDEKMRTNIPDIYAAGDVAEFNGQIFGLWNIAIGQGKVAGNNIASKDSTYEPIVPVTTLSAFNLSLFSMGEVQEEKATDILVEKESDKHSYRKVFFREGKVIGAIVVGDTKSSPALKGAIEKGIQLPNVDYKNTSFEELISLIKSNKK